MFKRIFALVLVLFSGVLLVACDTEDDVDKEEPDKIEFTVSFDTNGGNEIDPQVIEDGEKAVKPEDPIKEDHEFNMWLLDDEEFDFDTVITEDITLIADWNELEVPPEVVVRDTLTLDFSGLVKNKTYSTEPETFSISEINLIRYSANISTITNTDYTGVVLGIRTHKEIDDWVSPYLQSEKQIEGLEGMKITFVNWTNDANYNIDFAKNIFLQTSENGEDWDNIKDFKNDWDAGQNAVNVFDVDIENPGDLYFRIYIESAGEQDKYSLRILIKEIEIYTIK